LSLDAGATYFFQAGTVSPGPAHLQLNLQPVPPPANDDFAAATQIGSIPFVDTVDRTAATTETGEPVFTNCGQISHTVWYSFSPTTSGSYFATGNAPGVNSMMTLYSGSSVDSLTPLGCGQFDRLLFHADAGKTYFIQVGSFDGQPGAMQTFRLDVAPQLAMAAFGSPQDPSTFDTVQFIDQTFDPAGFSTIATQHWTFGDGTSADGCCVTHRYAVDGTYTATLTDTTFDGRTGTTSLTVTVKTHDVAVSNRRHPETVQVQLYKSVAGGSFQPVGSLTQSLPVLASNRTTSFSIDYTFVAEDRTLGKVTFEAVATIVGTRDAVPADNAAIAAPSAVGR
jgi:PKD domain